LWIASIMLLAQFSISALNEWADADLDAKGGRRRPIPLGLLPRYTALLAAAVFALAALLASAFSGFGLLPFALVVIGIGCGWAYDLKLKRTAASFLPFALAFPIVPVWVGVIAGHRLSSLWLIFLAGVPLATAINLADAIPDLQADQAAGVRTLAVVLGTPRADLAAAALLLVGSLVAITQAIQRGNSLPVFLLPAVALAYLGISLLSKIAPSRAPALGKWVLIAAAILVALPLVESVGGR
jgi:4-hydroxybenzoate polyprenyltransferase